LDIEQFLKEKAAEINKELELFLPRSPTKEWLDFAAGKPSYCHDIRTTKDAVTVPVWDFLDRGGKRWRPALMLLSCGAVGGSPEAIKEFVVMPELIHTGTIIVDDVEDNSLLRRGKPTLHRIYGKDIAVNAGNMLYFLPLRVLDRFMEKEKGFGSKALKIYSVYAEEMVKLSLGQAMDISWHRGGAKDVTEEQYLQMCVYKTGSLAKFSAELGAILGNASEKQVRLLGRFAASIGVAFQIQDDILNIAPSEGWGKETGDDINEGKRTLLVIRALKKSPEKKAARLLAILDSHTEKKEEIEEAISIIRESGAVEYTREKAKSIVEDSWKELKGAIKDSPEKESLRDFANYLIERRI
jgi:geranylgeranyl pyrophosphate synthase